ncbi:MAG: ATP-binding protein [Lachnospiraceae bacterium]|nr:ATP-binding protein [Lachnospiraceae bacterium]
MKKSFNVNGVCRPNRHYMADLTPRLEKIREMVARGDYFLINRGRQCGKTTLLRSLAVYLEADYEVVSLDFQRLGSQTYEHESLFVDAFTRLLLDCAGNLPVDVRVQLMQLRDETGTVKSLQILFGLLSDWCSKSEKPVVLLIDEVHAAVNNHIFTDFLAQLRAAYLDSDITPAFQSVILAGSHDMRHVKRTLSPEEEHRDFYPWNIAARFPFELNLRTNEISGMLREYENDSHTGMNIPEIAWLLYDYTCGYPVLVSGLCKIMDELLPGTPGFPEPGDVWTQKGLEAAVKILLREENPLFGSLWENLNCHPKMKNRIYTLLFRRHTIPYNVDDPVTSQLAMTGLIKDVDGYMRISNRIFETRLYNCFMMAAEAENIENSLRYR